MEYVKALVSEIPISPSFRGDARALQKEITNNLRVRVPAAAGVLVGGVEPQSNIGIWLKEGKKPYVWDVNLKKYVPAITTDGLVIPDGFIQADMLGFDVVTSIPDVPYARASMASDRIFSSGGSSGRLPFTNFLALNDTWYDATSYEVVIQVAGTYSVSMQALGTKVTGPASAISWGLTMYKNSDNAIAFASATQQATTLTTRLHASDIVKLAVGDRISVLAGASPSEAGVSCNLSQAATLLLVEMIQPDAVVAP